MIDLLAKSNPKAIDKRCGWKVPKYLGSSVQKEHRKFRNNRIKLEMAKNHGQFESLLLSDLMKS